LRDQRAPVPNVGKAVSWPIASYAEMSIFVTFLLPILSPFLKFLRVSFKKVKRSTSRMRAWRNHSSCKCTAFPFLKYLLANYSGYSLLHVALCARFARKFKYSLKFLKAAKVSCQHFLLLCTAQTPHAQVSEKHLPMACRRQWQRTSSMKLCPLHPKKFEDLTPTKETLISWPNLKSVIHAVSINSFSCEMRAGAGPFYSKKRKDEKTKKMWKTCI
jgi:hypothetical protein